MKPASLVELIMRFPDFVIFLKILHIHRPFIYLLILAVSYRHIIYLEEQFQSDVAHFYAILRLS